MKRKVVSALLAVAMVVSMLAGCGKDTTTTGDDSKKDTPSASEDGTSDTDQGEPYTVGIQLVNISTDLTDVEMVEAAINEITLPAINCKVDIQNLFIGDLPTTTSMNVVSGEKMDIVCVGLTQKLSGIADDGILLPLDEYLKYAPTYVSLVEPYLEAGNIEGVQYALPATPYVAAGTGLVYNKDMADKYGITLQDGAGFKEVTEAFKILKENGIYGTSNGQATALGFQFWYNTEIYGTNGDFGVNVDPALTTKIENLYASDLFKEYALQMKAWADAGYIPSDSLTDSTTVQEYFKTETLFSTPTAYTIDQKGVWQAGQSFQTEIVQLEDPLVTTAMAGERMWGIASNSENPQKAMEFLNYMYENPAIANLLQYGIEGQNYTMVEGTKSVTTAEGATTGTAGYTSMFTRFGNMVEVLTSIPNTDEFAEQVLAYNKDVVIAKSFGYTFDSSEFSAEAGAVANVIAEYLPRLQAGQVDSVEDYIKDFVAALDSAGYNDIIAGNQAQLDAYLIAQ